MSVVAVLQVLAFADAVGGDEQVEFAFAGEVLGPLLGAGREGGEDAGEVLAQVGQRRLVVAGAGDEGGVQAETPSAPTAASCSIEILGGVGKGGEDDDLAVAGVERVAALVLDDFAQGVELGVARGAHLLRGGEQRREAVAVLDQVLPPADAGPRPAAAP